MTLALELCVPSATISAKVLSQVNSDEDSLAKADGNAGGGCGDGAEIGHGELVSATSCHN